MSYFLIRSMSTTDMGPGRPPVPYHIYLLPVDKRIGAYWSSIYNAQKFDTREAAQAEIDRVRLTSCQIVSSDDRTNYWDR